MRTNERPRKKLHGKGTDTQTDRQTLQLLDQHGQEGRVGEKNIGASNRIGREIRCLPYAGFLAALSISRSLVVGLLVGRSVGPPL